MKKYKCKPALFLLVSGLWLFSSYAQITSTALEQFIAGKKNSGGTGLVFQPGVSAFYDSLDHQAVWFHEVNSTRRRILLHSLELAPGLGLREKDYQFDYAEGLRKGTIRLQNLPDSMEAELRLTDAAIHFFSDVAYGNSKPALGYQGLNYVPACRNIPAILAEFVFRHSLSQLTNYQSPIVVHADVHMPVIAWYNPAAVDSAGQLVFYEDIYEKSDWMKRK